MKKSMKLSFRALWVGAVLACLAVIGHADEAAEADEVKDVTDAKGGQALVERLTALRPGIPIEQVRETPLAGIYALELKGGSFFYGTADGKYLFAGDMYELTDTSLVNLAEAGRTAKRQALMAQVTAEEMVVFSPEGTTKASISVFTDVDCGYCQKLHLEVPKLNEMGIEVRYLAYPRAGVGSQSYQKIVSAWCSADRNTAITRLKARQTIPTLTCSNPVASQLDLGREVGVTGTPAIVLEDGRLLPGYMPAEQLAEALGI